MRTVFVTGSSRGIGFAIAREFVASGDRVVINGCTDRKQLDEAVEELRKLAELKVLPQQKEYLEYPDCKVFGILADMSDYSRAKAVFSEIKERFSPVDVLVNSAGRAHFGLFTDMAPDEWDKIIGHNLATVLNSTHLAVPDMVSAKNGVIINISSIWGNTGASCEAVYSAAKGAVHAFTKSMAQELGPSGIRVCAVACGAIETRMNDRLSQEERDDFIVNVSLGRFGTAQEVGQLVRFLASDEANYLTGQVIGLDGGM